MIPIGLSFLIDHQSGDANGAGVSTLLFSATYTVLAIVMWGSVAQLIRRLHDLGLSSYVAILYFLVVGNFFAMAFIFMTHGTDLLWRASQLAAFAVAILPLLIPGTQGANKFGPPPYDQRPKAQK